MPPKKVEVLPDREAESGIAQRRGGGAVYVICVALHYILSCFIGNTRARQS